MTKPSPSIDAIVTCHNYGRYLSRCLDSLLKQTLPYTKIILIDDASDDETPEVAEQYRDSIEYRRVEFKNHVFSREAGLKESNSDFFVHVDADNFLAENFNEELVKPLLQDSSLGFTYCGNHYIFEGTGKGWPYRNFFTLVTFNERILRRRNYIDNCSMVRREAWQGECPELPAYEDWERWLRIVDAGWKGFLVRKRLFHYRIHKDGMGVRARVAGKSPEIKKYVRRRHPSHDLSVVTCLSGNRALLPEFLKAYESLEKPRRTQLLLIDNSGEADFHRELRGLGLNPIVFPHRAQLSRHEPLSEANQIKKAAHCARLYQFAKEFATGRDILFWEHDILPREDALSRLMRTREVARADLIGAAVISRVTGDYQSWRFYQTGPALSSRRVAISRQPKRVQCTGFSFLLMEREIFYEMPLIAKRPNTRFFGCDLNAGVWAHHKNLRWFVDGATRCRHLHSNLEAAKLGQGLRDPFAHQRTGEILYHHV